MSVTVRSLLLPAVLWIAFCLEVAYPEQRAVNERAIKEVESGERHVAKASWWGYDPEDATKALQASINSGARKVVVENMGTPWIVDKIELASDQELFFEKGVVVLAKRGAFRGTGDSLFTALLKKNVTLTGYGAMLKMWKQDYASKEYVKGEWRMVLCILSCSNVRVSGLTLAESGGDGIYLGVGKKGVTNTNVRIKDVVCADNYRQGISVISAENLLIENCVLKDTSGTPPMAGIDFEPNESSEKLVNCVMRNCVSENNRGDAYDFYIPTLNADSAEVSIRLENCQSRGCMRAVAITTGNDERAAVKGRMTFVNCKFEGSEYSGIIVNQKPVNGCKLRFVNCEITDSALKHPEQSPISFSSGTGNVVNIGGVGFVNCTVKDPVERLPVDYLDLAGGLHLSDVTGTLTVERNNQRTVHKLDQKLVDTWMPHQVHKDIKRFQTKGVRYEPVSPGSEPEAFGKCSARQRVHAEYLLFARAGEQVSFTVLIQPVGPNPPQPTPVRVVSPSGKEIPLPNTRDGQETPYSFVAEETGAHKVLSEPGNSTSQVNSTSHRLCQYSETGAIHFLGTAGEFFFWVPAGVSEFGIRVAGDNAAERVKAGLYDPSGKLVEELDSIAQTHQFVGARTDSSKGEVWSLRLDRPSQGILEDFHVQMQGIPPVLSCTREALLKPVR